MGWWQAAGQVARDLIGMPRPISLDLPPLQTFDTAPRPIDMVLTAMRNGQQTAVTRDDALSVAAVLRARNELCSIATLPLRLFKGLGAVDNALFRQYDPDVPNVKHMSWTIEDLIFDGIAWWQVTGQDFYQYPASVRRIDPCKVSLKPPGHTPGVRNTIVGMPPLSGVDDGTPGRWVWIDKGEGKWEQIPTALMIRFDSPNPGILKAMARMIRVAIALDRLIEMYATNPSLRELYTDNPDSDEDAYKEDDIQAFLAEVAAMRQMSPYGWLPSQVKKADVSAPSPKDLTLVELRQEVNLAIANGLGVDPEDLGVSTTSRTYFNSVDKKQDKINRTYAPFMSAIVDRLAMGDVTMRGYAPRFDLTDYLKSDPTTQAAYWAQLKAMGVVDEQWIGEQAGIDPAVTARVQPAAVPAGAPPAAIGQNAHRPPIRLGDITPARFAATAQHTFGAAELGADPATVDTASRTITGLALPYNTPVNRYGVTLQFDPGSLEYSSPDRMPALIDHVTPVGMHSAITMGSDGPTVSLRILDAPEGTAAQEQRNLVLHDAAQGMYSGLSVGVDFSMFPEDGDVVVDDDGVYHVVRATWRETSITALPQFDDARVTQVAASRNGGNSVDPCQNCGHRHAPNIACVTFAHQLAAQPVAPAQLPGPGAPGIVPANPPTPAPAMTPEMAAAFQAYVQQFTAQQATLPVAPAPVLVNPNHSPAVVTEPQPYRFDRRGNLTSGSHDFSSDIWDGWAPQSQQDQAARDRANEFVRTAFENKQFAITPANVAPLNYPQNHPEMYVDQMEFQYPVYDAVYKGTLDSQTPFILPKFSASSGLVADHVSGTEPTPGAMTATSQTITPSPVSGKVEILRETYDQGGNPQASGLIWRQMIRGWYEALEAYVIAQFVAAAASIPDLVITTAAVDSALDQALTDALVPLQYIRGGDRFRRVFTQIDLYKAMVKAKDTAGRRLYPSINPQNAVGSADSGYASVDAHGKLWIPAWATAATSANAASSYMFDPEKVALWASAPQRLDIVWRVAWVDMGLFGYKAFGITDFQGTRELIYDPV